MRRVRYSRTARVRLARLLELVVPRYGVAKVAEKRNLLRSTVKNHLAQFPRVKQRHPELGLVVYLVSNTPFMVLYDYDDDELRFHFIFFQGTPIDEIEPEAVEW